MAIAANAVTPEANGTNIEDEMTALLTLDHVTLALDDGTPLVRELSFSMTHERIGPVGRNGSGKSTLLSLIEWGGAPTAGSIERTTSVGAFRQHWTEESTVAQALGASQMLARLDRLAAGQGDASDLAEADWSLPTRLEHALTEVGLAGAAAQRTVSELSGGERVRLGLASLLLARPELLLLDEPTNDLDRQGRELVSQVIRGWSGAVLIASHDRELLEQVDRIVEISAVGCHIVSGGWSAFEADRNARRDRAEAERARSADLVRSTRNSLQRQKERKARRDKAGRSYAAKDIEPRMYLHAQAQRAERSGARGEHLGHRLLTEAEEKLEDARQAVEVVTPLRIDLPATGLPSDRRLLEINDASVAFTPDRRLGPYSLVIRGPERVALVGGNGTGKSTLLRIANGDLIPTGGTVERAAGRSSLLDQHVSLLAANVSVVNNIRAHNPDLDLEQAHAIAARFAFRADAALKPTAVLSGGERMRAALACVTGGGTPAQLLLLDEPTNHLDIDAIETLEKALHGFDGALLIASHDHAFLKRIGVTRWLDLEAAGRGGQLLPSTTS